MTTPEPIVVRRFQIHAEPRTLDAVQQVLTTRANRFTSERLESRITRSRWSPTLTVRLVGDATAVARMRESVPVGQGVTVLRDWLDVPASAGTDNYPNPRALMRIDPDGRARGETGSGEPVVVAIVDSGITTDHPKLANHLWAREDDGHRVHGARCMGGVEVHDVTDQDGHGTMLAGTIVATANGVRGLQLMAVKFYDVTTPPTAANAAAAIAFAAKQRPAVINLSFDLGIGSHELGEAIHGACQDGALVVIAAGNTGGDNDQYPVIPASYAGACLECRDKVIVAMATDRYDERPAFSNFGASSVDLAAPGVDILSTRRPVSRDPGARIYGRYTGTSAAAAHVTGAAALLKSQHPRRTAKDLKACLMESVDPRLGLRCVSRGRLNLGRALYCKR